MIGKLNCSKIQCTFGQARSLVCMDVEMDLRMGGSNALHAHIGVTRHRYKRQKLVVLTAPRGWFCIRNCFPKHTPAIEVIFREVKECC